MNIWLNSLAYFVLIGAHAFGWLYNWLYEKYRPIAKMYTAYAVAFGCATLFLLGLYFVGLFETLFLLALFTAAGIPMILGDMLRSAKDQEARLKEEVHKAKEEAKAAKTRRGPREWPNFAKDVRDDTAEDLNRLLSDLAKAKGETDPHKLTLLLAHTQIVLHTSLRRLESVDAPTRPPQP